MVSHIKEHEELTQNQHKRASVKKLPSRLFLFILIPILVILIFAALFYVLILYKLPSPQSLRNSRTTPLSTHIYDRNGKLLYEFYKEQNRTFVSIKTLPQNTYQSTIAIEDKDFYKHNGVSLVSGIFRAIKDTVFGQNLQGGSTITQQLVKSALLTPERTI
ncbi:hypothetical protein COY87_02715, partial [Candidatus Roizmanbacteria bacterium CG_4_10_14_0_8_um_filter_33_9]